jgi:glutathione S-transferase
LKFYDCKTAPSPRRVRIFLAEKGVDIDTEQVDLGAGEQFSDAFRKVNPDCVVPALVLDDGTCLSEAIAICQYLEELHPEPPLFGTTPEERALVSMWNAKIEQQGLWAAADALRNFAKSFRGKAVSGPESYEQIPALAERGKERAAQFFHRLDEQLAEHRFIVGDRYSVADITALAFVDFAKWIKLEIPDSAGNLKRWYAEVSGRASAAA